MSLPAAIISGGSRGIGYAIAQQLCATHRVAILSRNHEAATSAAASLAGIGHIGICCNVTDPVQVGAAVALAHTRFETATDVLVNAAGVTQSGLLLRTSEEEVAEVLDTNLLGPMLLSKMVLKGMLRQRRGCILSIGSVLGSIGMQGEVAYSASKAGLVGFTKSLSKEVAPRGIRVNLLAPGYVSTAMTDIANVDTKSIPLGRMATAEEIAKVAMFLLGPDASYITGQVLVADGGLT